MPPSNKEKLTCPEGCDGYKLWSPCPLHPSNKEAVTEVLEVIREVCDLPFYSVCSAHREEKEYCIGCKHGSYAESHLEHLLWAIFRQTDDTPHTMTEDNYCMLTTLEKGRVEWLLTRYCIEKSVEQNLNDNPDLTEWLHEVLVNKK